MDDFGYVYVLSNISMPGIVKIGKSNAGGHKRAHDLFVTGVPTKFRVEFEIYVYDPLHLEQAVHESLDKSRVGADREFFRCDPNDAIIAILNEYASYHDHTVVNSDEFEAVEAARLLSSESSHDAREICHSMRFISHETINAAVEKKREWIKKRHINGLD